NALEKRDAEQLGLLRSTHELAVLNAVRKVKQLQIEEAQDTLAGLRKSWEVVNERFTYYRKIEHWNAAEKAQVGLEGFSLAAEVVPPTLKLLASLFHLIPDTKIGAPTSMGATEGGSNAGASTADVGNYLMEIAKYSSHAASLVGLVNSYQRRND